MGHSYIGASGAHRWMECPGSVKLNMEFEDVASPYALEGTAAHELAEWKLREATGQLTGEARPEAWDEEMETHTDTYVNYVLGEHNRCQAKDGRIIHLIVEGEIVLDAIDPRLYGTADAMFYCASEMRTYVFDLKYGKGLYVDVEDNKQLLYYGLGGYYENFPRDVKVHVIQPRLDNVGEVVYSAAQMVEFEEKLVEAVRKVDEEPDKFNPGEKQCKFCKGKGQCPALTRKYVAMLTDKTEMQIELKDETQLTDGELSHIFNKKKEILDFMESVGSILETKMLSGIQIPNAKLVQSKGAGTWADTGTKEAREVKDPDPTSPNWFLLTPAQLQRFSPDLHERLCTVPLIAVPITDKRAPVFVKNLELTTIEGE